MKIYHNPRCKKSRETLHILQDAGQEPEVIEYLKNPPTAAELQTLIDKLGIAPEQLVRKQESIYKEQFKGKTLTADEWVAAMVQYPKLIERPIVVKGDKAVLGRPPEAVNTLL